MEVAIAGDFGVPLLMITGDSHGVQEAESLIPGCVGVTVKEARGPNGAVCHATARTRRWLRSAARQVASSGATAEPYPIGPGVTLEITLDDGDFQEAVRRIAGSRMAGAVLTLVGKRAIEVWAEYWQIRIRAQAMTKEHRES
jgi:D-amino peptidase